MKRLILFLVILLSASASADISSKLNIRTEDGTVNTYPYQARFTNGNVTDNNDGTVSISITGGSGSGSGIVSPGTFTWTNSFGISASTISVSTITAPSGIGAVVIDTGVAVGHLSAVSPSTITIYGKDPTNTGFGVGPYSTIAMSYTTSLMSPLVFTAFNPAAAGGEKAFIFNSIYSALGGYYIVDFQSGGVSKFSIANDGSIALAAGASFTADTMNSNFNRALTLGGGFGSTGAENQPVYVFHPSGTTGNHGDLVEFWDGNAIQHFIHGSDNSFNRANNWCIDCTLPLAQLEIRTFEDSRKGLIIQSHSATQSANLFETQDISSNTVTSISPAGVFTASSTVLTFGITAATGTFSSLTSGQCVQAGTGGLLTTTGSSCGGSSLTIGNAVSGGAAKAFLFEDASQNLDALSTVTFDTSTKLTTFPDSIKFGTTIVTLQSTTDGANTNIRIVNPGVGTAIMGSPKFAGTVYSGTDQFINMNGNGLTFQGFTSGGGTSFPVFVFDVETAQTGNADQLMAWRNAGASRAFVDKDGHFGIRIGTSTTQGRMGGSLFDHYVSSGSSTTLETDLFTDTLPANTFSRDGDKLVAEYGLTLVNSTSSKEVKLYLAGTIIFDSGALSLSASGDMDIKALVIRDSPTSVRYTVTANTTGASTGVFSSVGTLGSLTLTGTNILKVTGTAAGVGAATNDILAILGNVQWQSVS